VGSDIEERVFVGCFDVVQPLGRHAVRQQGLIGHVGEQCRLGRRRLLDLDVLRHLDFEHLLANLDDLHRPGLRVALDSPAFGPLVRLVVMIHVAEQQAGIGLVDDQPNVAADPHRPEVLVLRSVQLVEPHPRIRRVHL
jgi:hypothetical protein